MAYKVYKKTIGPRHSSRLDMGPDITTKSCASSNSCGLKANDTHTLFGSIKQGTERILVIKGVPQSEEPRALLFGFTLSFSLRAILEKHKKKSS